jgi:hypothetical protein
MVNWLKEKCPVCHCIFEYAEGGYKPKTCNRFECVYAYHHHPEKYKSFIEHIDDCRKESGI